jgi:CheY-like chemotaxis protein
MKRIILVDNDRVTRDLTSSILGGYEFDVVAFDSATKALFSICAVLPDLLIVDQATPDMAGLDLVAKIRQKTLSSFPVVLLSENPSPAIKTGARDLGIRHVFKKPVAVSPETENVGFDGTYSRLAAIVRRELYWSDAAETIGHLDTLRSEFLIDLSHQLRTPITAMKMAMDGLFAQLREVMNPSQRNLAGISRRNVDRIVSLVENQLDLLQLMAGDRPVCRRLVDVKALVSSLAGDSVSLQENVSAEPLYVFTVPDVLVAVIDGMLGAASPNARRSLSLDYHNASGICQVDVRVDFIAQPDCHSPSEPRTPEIYPPVHALDFEYRAYDALLGLAGGSLEMEKDDNHKWIRICLPRYPEYDRHKDFLEPVGSLSREKSGNSVVFFKVELGERAGGDYLSARDHVVHGLLGRCFSVVTEGDMILRGRRNGTIYLALADRSLEELDHITTFLEAGCNTENGIADPDGPFVWKPQTVAPDQRDVEYLIDELERVR